VAILQAASESRITSARSEAPTAAPGHDRHHQDLAAAVVIAGDFDVVAAFRDDDVAV
jgi:hypothetical protein